MAEFSSEQTVQSILPLIKYYFLSLAQKKYSKPVDDIEFIQTATRARRGVTGTVLISNVTYSVGFDISDTTIAMKFFEDKKSALNEMKNALELDIRFKTAPEFGIPKVIFASTQDPVLIIYEGISGTNYDELDNDAKPEVAGRLLAAIHGPQTRPVDMSVYRDIIRMLGSQLSVLGKEREISSLLKRDLDKLNNAMSGTNPFSDYHQSNVMITQLNGEISKAYVIDPEFMQTGSFDRMEDIGTFFGYQFYQEFVNSGSVQQSLSDLQQFLDGYEEKNKENGGYEWRALYPNGNPLGFFMAQWALMDALDIIVNRGGEIQSGQVANRVNFVLFILGDIEFNF